MSLIERAVARLARRDDVPAPANDDKTTVSPEFCLDQPHPIRVEPRHFDGPGANGAAVARQESPAGRHLGPPVALDLEKLKERGYATPSGRATLTGQEFRSIKSLILEKAFGAAKPGTERARCVIVTSSVPGEGKTFCAINLALSVASTGDRPVLLVDADVARPAIAREMGLEPSEGLIAFLTGKQSDPFRVVRPTNLPTLKVVPAGTAETHSGELLAGSAMATFLERICAGFPDHLVIVDTPPLLAVTETRSVVKRGGQILMVVAAGTTPRKSVDAALAAIPAGCDVSVILNKSQQGSEGGNYYYGY
jgi:protein-tyrosine kinase